MYRMTMALIRFAVLGVGCTSFGALGQVDDLDQILEQYAAVGQMHMIANMQLEISSGGELCCTGLGTEAVVPIEGSLVYSADGEMWRLDSFMDPVRYPGMDTSLLYDGQLFAYFEAGVGVLATQADANPKVWGMMLPNPAFEAVQFLFPMTDENAHRQPRLVDVQALAAETTLQSIVWGTGIVDDVVLDLAEFPGGVYDGTSYTFHVYTKPGVHSRPLVIDRVDSDGALLTRTRLSIYETIPLGGGVSVWPRTIAWQVFDPLDGVGGCRNVGAHRVLVDQCC